MVDRSAGLALDRVFRALASEPRRRILRLLSDKEQTVTELAADFDMSLAAVSKHVHVLESAKLLEQTKDGRLQWCRFKPEALAPARASIEELIGFWNERLDGLERFLTTSPQKKGKRRR